MIESLLNGGELVVSGQYIIDRLANLGPVSSVGTVNINPLPVDTVSGLGSIRLASAGRIEVGTTFPSGCAIGNNTNFDFKVYVKLTTTAPQMWCGNLRNATGTGNYWITLNNTYQQACQLSFDGISTAGGVQRFRFGVGSTIPTNRWVKLELKRVNKQLSFYIDDVQVDSVLSMPNGFVTTYTYPFNVGGSVDDTYLLSGWIDDLSLSFT